MISVYRFCIIRSDRLSFVKIALRLWHRAGFSHHERLPLPFPKRLSIFSFRSCVLHDETNGTFGLRKMFDALMMIRFQEILVWK
jgi:hypothetical protein